jgi:His-Xaa-Ser system protein HxsD
MVVTPIDETSIQIKIDGTLYSSEVVHKCFYWYAGKYSVDISTEGKSFIVKLADPKQEWDIQSVVSKIKTDLIDFKTREIVSNETKNIREMLIAKAFAHNDEFEEQPSGNINDPVGFDPSKI